MRWPFQRPTVLANLMELAIIAEAEIVNTGVGAVKQAKTDELRWGVDH